MVAKRIVVNAAECDVLVDEKPAAENGRKAEAVEVAKCAVKSEYFGLETAQNWKVPSSFQ